MFLVYLSKDATLKINENWITYNFSRTENLKIPYFNAKLNNHYIFND